MTYAHITKLVVFEGYTCGPVWHACFFASCDHEPCLATRAVLRNARRRTFHSREGLSGFPMWCVKSTALAFRKLYLLRQW